MVSGNKESDETLVLLQSPEAVSQHLTKVLHQHQGLVKLHNLHRNLILGLRAPVYKPSVGAGAVSDHLVFIGNVQERERRIKWMLEGPSCTHQKR